MSPHLFGGGSGGVGREEKRLVRLWLILGPWQDRGLGTFLRDGIAK
jgi:hypothetical protein